MSSASQTPVLPVMWLSWGHYRTCKQKNWLKCACFLSKVNTILKVVIFKHSVILFRCSMICRWPEPWNFKTAISGLYIRFHPVYRPCFYFIRKHMTPFYLQQKLPDNREYIKIQELLLKQSYVQRNI